jgi:hypothetical protein
MAPVASAIDMRKRKPRMIVTDDKDQKGSRWMMNFSIVSEYLLALKVKISGSLCTFHRNVQNRLSRCKTPL